MQQFMIAAACLSACLIGGMSTELSAAVADTDPVAIQEVKPQYPKDALKEKRQGTVWLTIEVKADGTVGDVRVTQTLSARLDAEAVKAAKQWRFKPATKDGKAVRVETQLEMTFKLR